MNSKLNFKKKIFVKRQLFFPKFHFPTFFPLDSYCSAIYHFISKIIFLFFPKYTKKSFLSQIHNEERVRYFLLRTWFLNPNPPDPSTVEEQPLRRIHLPSKNYLYARLSFNPSPSRTSIPLSLFIVLVVPK
jgi:hypothetical protein